MERLSKVLAQAGVASRRKAEELIQSNRVKVNGQVVNVLGSKVTAKDVILVDDQPIQKEPLFYYLLNKPTGYLSTVADEHKRRNILDLFSAEDKRVRLYPISKLEYDTAGALIVTNDGELTKHLTQSQVEIESEYNIRVKGIVIKDKIRTLRRGIVIEQKLVAPKDVQILELDKPHQSTLIRILMQHADSKLVRKMFQALGHEVKNMTRIRYDFLNLEGIERGTYRILKSHEVKKLYRELNG